MATITQYFKPSAKGKFKSSELKDIVIEESVNSLKRTYRKKHDKTPRT